MKKMIQVALLASAFALLAACGGPTIDGKNAVTFEQSMTAMIADMTQEDGLQLTRDISTISASVMKELGGMTYENATKIGDVMLETLDGKTAGDINDMAQDIREG